PATIVGVTTAERSQQYEQLLRDLRDERGVLGALLPTLPDEAWDRPSPAEGWLLRDCVVHLAETDESAAAIAEGSALAARRGQGDGVLTAGMNRGRAMRPHEVLSWWRAAGERMLAALSEYKGDERLTWAGRPMSVISFRY
ncbi:MAG: maleylpyruvate isomerase N-terminal domain-containing protein, partial [Bacteroidota bacterium]|nr:maleylpyruvate isomerase N-terminal domain-containing protein [Bacteroidota bacterium]